ncbi:lipid-A-disaccharide synthase [Verrucomicrobium sp. GAS474]|uniref:lipid-A-disaccharide synthase n=1 Tax=Verrucomicrobium sp. GAS474 TaxID=1882831 RepID=UPI00087B06B4|nr:lipid-A-disaccharide synthase [Verrucomicrobium sp. GAS474]SDU17183.1 lipid-A-disaccharide synthase [Verrucomicrobium sp. GAS474]
MSVPVPESLAKSVSARADGRPPVVFLIAGEPSGDGHGAELVNALRRFRPDLRCIGTGGPRMRAAGQEQLFDLTDHAVVGFVEVLKHYPTLRDLFGRLLALAKEEQPDAVVFIDYPGFNLRFAKALRKIKALKATKLVYYISPQVWAWKSGRAKTMAKILDLLLVIFPFEKDWFAERVPKLRTEWVGHPIWDRIQPKGEETGNRIERRVALLPGSREGEIRKHLPILIETARDLMGRHPNLRFVWMSPDLERQRLGQRILLECGGGDIPIESYVGYQLSHLSRCDLALLASGTVSLECACMDVPQIVFYKVNPLTYFIGRMVVKVPYVSMVNVLADREVVPEFIQSDLSPALLSARASELLKDAVQQEEMRKGMRRVVERLGKAGASVRAAEAVLREIGVAPLPVAAEAVAAKSSPPPAGKASLSAPLA